MYVAVEMDLHKVGTEGPEYIAKINYMSETKYFFLNKNVKNIDVSPPVFQPRFNCTESFLSKLFILYNIFQSVLLRKHSQKHFTATNRHCLHKSVEKQTK